jgi:hypothetical protein
MDIRAPGFDVWINAQEVDVVRASLRAHGWDQRAEAFSGARLHDLLEAWAHFVESEWETMDVDVSEYNDELHVRDVLEIVFTALGQESAARLGAVLAGLDACFLARMRPVGPRASVPSPFWHANTIYGTPPMETS